MPAIAAAGVALAVAAAAFYAGRTTAPAPPHPTFTNLTFRPQSVFRALFAPDGKTIVYSGALAGGGVGAVHRQPGDPESRSFGLRDVQLLSVSSKSELAVLTHARYLSHRLYQGTLARMPLGGGAPREILEGVREADWSPDGEQLAIVRSVNGSDRLEFPVGKVLFETPGYVSDCASRRMANASRSSSTRRNTTIAAAWPSSISQGRRRCCRTGTAASRGWPGRATVVRFCFPTTRSTR